MHGKLYSGPACGVVSTILTWVLLILIAFSPAAGADKSSSSPEAFVFQGRPLEAEWGGHLIARGTVSWIDEVSIFQAVDTGEHLDGSLEGRLKNRLYWGRHTYLDTHYEIIFSGGDTRKNQKELLGRFPALSGAGVLSGPPVSDDRRLMDLTATIEETDDYILYHRLDRLALTLLPPWGKVRIGRQAVTWGNGLLFNPMDLFSPFAPTDIERNYKFGDDLALVEFATGNIGSLQMLYVPRRDPSDDNVKWNQSSLASKLHVFTGTVELDFMAAHHYSDQVVGIGSTGYVKQAAWRLDVLWTVLNESGTDSYLSLVANMDYSWIWRQKNMYGFIEYYHNGLGESDYTAALSDPDLLKRLDRGEMFALGRDYISGHIRVELHPLFNVALTATTNLADSSGFLQPYAVWDILQNFQITAGGSIFYGGENSEFGGFKLPSTAVTNRPADRVFIWLSHYF